MSTPSARLALALAACGLLANCGLFAAGAGEACGPSQSCAAGLTCRAGTCVSGAATDGGPKGDGGRAADGGPVTDGGPALDGGPVTDGGPACGPCDTPPDDCHAALGTCDNGTCLYAPLDGASCNDGDPCTVQDTCHSGTCTGTAMVCDTPPAPACLSGTELSTYDQTGVCQAGQCTYSQKTIQCTGGCVNNACQTDPCASMTCNTPPSVCYGSAGTCSNGSCTYPYANGATCDDGDACTTNDTCNTGVCKGVPIACNTPPAGTCQDANTAKTYDASGTCAGGTCSYTSHLVSCALGCVNGACKADPCASVTCDTPPSVCYSHYGTCSNGTCSYGYDNGANCDDGDPCTAPDHCSSGACQGAPVVCDTPPANTCQDANTAKVYSTAGTCSAGACSYPSHLVTCTLGCIHGLCKDPPWIAMTSNTTADLWSVWGTSATDVWAGGTKGTILHWDGTQWKSFASGWSDNIEAITGTSSTDVEALGYEWTVLHFDGSKWSVQGTIQYLDNVRWIHAIGPDDFIAVGDRATAFPGITYAGIDEVWPGNEARLGTATDPDSGAVTGSWAFSKTNVYVSINGALYHFDGSTLSRITAAKSTTYNQAFDIWAAGPNAIFTEIDGYDYHNHLQFYDGKTWSVLDTGFPGTVGPVAALSATRVFVLASDTTYTDAVLTYDGVSWTQAATPAGTKTLNAIWAAPNGEVFAVGDNGVIVHSP